MKTRITRESNMQTIYEPDLGECKQGQNPDAAPRCIQNQRQRAKIRNMAQRGECWLIRVNGYNMENWQPAEQYKRGLVYNFGAEAIAPRHDKALCDLIQARADAEYTGTRADYARIQAIEARLYEIGGEWLSWR